MPLAISIVDAMVMGHARVIQLPLLRLLRLHHANATLDGNGRMLKIAVNLITNLEIALDQAMIRARLLADYLDNVSTENAFVGQVILAQSATCPYRDLILTH